MVNAVVTRIVATAVKTSAAAAAAVTRSRADGVYLLDAITMTMVRYVLNRFGSTPLRQLLSPSSDNNSYTATALYDRGCVQVNDLTTRYTQHRSTDVYLFRVFFFFPVRFILRFCPYERKTKIIEKKKNRSLFAKTRTRVKFQAKIY